MRLIREIRHIPARTGHQKLIILRPAGQKGPVPGILWIHGGGYMTGMAAMVYGSCGRMLARKYGAVVVSPGYRLAWKKPYPAALEDCYTALEYMADHAEELGIRRDQLIVGGESAGGGLAAAVCLYARDQGRIPVAFQIPLYPMLDCFDTPSSRDNHGHNWNTRRNHWGWKHYLGSLYGSPSVPKYASPSRETDYTGLPPAYTYVLDGEPFLDETRTYIRNLQEAGVDAAVDVYPGNFHGFDVFFWTRNAKTAKRKLCEQYAARFASPSRSPEGAPPR
ncbi:MAG: alpha/beta hydrolase [Clostridia bacterium]|nr:alpha/beta hydrolase [Clostridia bacterium]